MIDWKRKCLELAEIVNSHRKERLHKDMLRAWELAKEIIKLGKVEEDVTRN